MTDKIEKHLIVCRSCHGKGCYHCVQGFEEEVLTTIEDETLNNIYGYDDLEDYSSLSDPYTLV